MQTPADYARNHIRGSINVPLEIIEKSIMRVVINKETTLIVCCQRGIRSEVACIVLEKMGYRNVYNIKGGFETGG